MNASSAETNENRNTKFRLNTAYTNCRINSEAEKIEFRYINFVLDKYAKNPEKCNSPIALGLYKEFIRYWRGCLLGYFIPTQRTSQSIWMQSQPWNNKARRFELRRDAWGHEYILTKFGKIYAYDYLPIPINQLEQSYKEMQDLMKCQIDYIISRGHLEVHKFAYLPGLIKITSVEELQDYYGEIAKSLDSH